MAQVCCHVADFPPDNGAYYLDSRLVFYSLFLSSWLGSGLSLFLLTSKESIKSPASYEFHVLIIYLDAFFDIIDVIMVI